jgi:hypothetical protein
MKKHLDRLRIMTMNFAIEAEMRIEPVAGIAVRKHRQVHRRNRPADARYLKSDGASLRKLRAVAFHNSRTDILSLRRRSSLSISLWTEPLKCARTPASSNHLRASSASRGVMPLFSAAITMSGIKALNDGIKSADCHLTVFVRNRITCSRPRFVLRQASFIWAVV